MIYKRLRRKKGRLFAVGDLHGCYDEFQEKLKEVGFKKSEDTMLSVGDLADRGKDSIKCMELAQKKWFHPVFGNHEDLAMKSFWNDWFSKQTWIMEQNGGGWYDELPEEDKDYAKELIENTVNYPVVIEAHFKGKKIIVCHSDYPYDEYEFNKGRGEYDDTYYAIWDRNRIHSSIRGKTKRIDGADLFIFGHTPIKSNEPLLFENQLYIDTSAVLEDGVLTIVNVEDYL